MSGFVQYYVFNESSIYSPTLLLFPLQTFFIRYHLSYLSAAFLPPCQITSSKTLDLNSNPGSPDSTSTQRFPPFKDPKQNFMPVTVQGKQFIKCLINIDCHDTSAIFNVVLTEDTRGQILVFQNKREKYTSQRQMQMLNYDERGPPDGFHNLIIQKDKDELQYTSVGKSGEPSVFVALGSLVEKTIASTKANDRCTTNCFLLRNISTEPSSL